MSLKSPIFIFLFLFLFLSEGFCQSSLSKGLLAYYPLDGDAKDGCLNKNDGYILNVTPAKNRFDVANKAIHVVGGGVEIYNVNIPVKASTITVWVKPDRLPDFGKRNILSKHFSYANCELLIRIRPDGYYSAEWNVGATYFDITKESGALLQLPSYTNFDFLVLRYDGLKVDFFVNNKLVARKLITGDIVNNTKPITIGSLAYFPKREAYSGAVDELRIYNRSLTNIELTQLFESKD